MSATAMKLLERSIQPDYEALRQCVLRRREPERVHYAELLLDEDIIISVGKRFNLAPDVDASDLVAKARRDMEIYGFLGYDVFPVTLSGFTFPMNWISAEDPHHRNAQGEEKRNWIDEHQGPIQTWDDFERYPWPRLEEVDTRPLEWLNGNLRDGMKAYCWNDQVFERLSGLLGFESLCFMLRDNRKLVEAVAHKAGELCVGFTKLLCEFPCIEVIWDSDDLGYRSQTLLAPDTLRALVLPWHKKSAQVAHEYGRLHFMHSCGNVAALMEDWIRDVGTDAKHSFEDTILPVTEAVATYGSRIGIIGGIDVDFLCRNNEARIRERVRATLETCHRGGGYVLGSGNSIPNFMPLDHYLIMLDEGRRFLPGF